MQPKRLACFFVDDTQAHIIFFFYSCFLGISGSVPIGHVQMYIALLFYNARFFGSVWFWVWVDIAGEGIRIG